MERGTLFSWEEWAKTILLWHEPCHSAAPMPLLRWLTTSVGSFVQLILCIVRPARSAQGRVCPCTTHKMLFILGNGSLLFPAALPCSLSRLYTGSAARSAATMRHLLPTEKACRACAAADCRPHTTDLTGAGRAGCHCTLRPGTDRAVHHGRAGIDHCPALRAPQAGDFFCTAATYPFLPWRSSGSLTAEPPRYFSDNPLTHWHVARYRRGSPPGDAGWWDRARRARARGWCTPPPVAVRARDFQ